MTIENIFITLLGIIALVLLGWNIYLKGVTSEMREAIRFFYFLHGIDRMDEEEPEEEEEEEKRT